MKTFYISFWFLLSPSWKVGPAGIDNILALRAGSGPAELRVILWGNRDTAIVGSLRLAGLHKSFSGSTTPVLAPNVSPQTVVARASWQHFEMVFRGNDLGQANGKLSWWLDGALVGDYDGLEYWGPGGRKVKDLAWDLTAPSLGTSVQQRITLDEMYVSSPPASGDRIVIRNDQEIGGVQAAPPATTILLDALSGNENDSCLNDKVVGAQVVLPNLLRAADVCPHDEIVVLSTYDAALIDGGGQGIWSDAGGEIRTLVSRPLRPVEIVLWLAQEKDGRDRSVETIARGEIETGNLLFNDGRAGFRLEVSETKEVWDNSPDAVAARAAMGCRLVEGKVACTCMPGLTTSPYFKHGKLNAYYVPDVFDNPTQPRLVSGLNCRYDHNQNPLDPNVVFVSLSSSSPTALSHEIGHALGLEHTVDGNGDWYPGKTPADNLMRGDEWLTFASLLLGQSYRTNVDSRSILRLNAIQSGPERSCECEPWAACPLAQFIAESELGVKCPALTRKWP